MKKSNKFLSKLFKNSDGFSLAEIMVAAGMLGVLSLGVMQVMKNMQRGSKRMKQDYEAQTIVAEVQKTLADRNACSASLGGLALTDTNFTPIPSNNLKDSDDKVILAVDQVFGSQTLLTVKEISYRGFYNPDFTAPGDKYQLSNTALFTDIPGYSWDHDSNLTTPPEQTDVKRGVIHLQVVFEKGNTVLGTRNIEKNSIGGKRLTRRFPITVLIDNANNILECFGDQDMYADAACASLGGDFTLSDGKCKNIKVEDSELNTGDNFGIAAINTTPTSGNGNIRAENGIFVGTTDLDKAPAAGVIHTENGATIGYDNSVDSGNFDFSSNPGQGNLRVLNGSTFMGLGAAPLGVGVGVAAPTGAGNVQINNALGVGAAPPTNPGEALINNSLGVGAAPPSAAGTAKFNNSIAVGTTYSTTNVNGEAVIEKGIGVGLGVGISPTAKVHAIGVGDSAGLFVNGTTNVDIADSSSNILKAVTGSSNITINSAAKITIDTDQIVINDLAQGYPAIRVKGQDKLDMTATGTKGEELATKEWVGYQVWGTRAFTDLQKSGILANIIDYAQHHTILAIQDTVCKATYVRNADGTMTQGSWTGSACNLLGKHCTDSTGNSLSTSHCETLTVYADKGTFKTVTADTGNITTVNSTTVNSTSINWSGTATGGQLIASRIRTTGVGWVSNSVNASKICANGSCATRFGRQVCPGDSIVKGIANGRVFCALNATTATQPIGTDF